jgi:hypothetical protein
MNLALVEAAKNSNTATVSNYYKFLTNKKASHPDAFFVLTIQNKTPRKTEAFKTLIDERINNYD